MAGKNQHVVPYKNEWAVRGANNSKVTITRPVKSEVINLAIKIAKNQKSEVIIHGRNGRIQDSDSYGNDPFPPKDKKY